MAVPRLLVAAVCFALAGVASAAAPVGPPSVVSAFSYEYIPGDHDEPVLKRLELVEGGTLVFVNLDPLDFHTVTSVDLDADRRPIFGTPSDLGFGQLAIVEGTEKLAARPEPYVFTCTRHSFMTGEFIVVPLPG